MGSRSGAAEADSRSFAAGDVIMSYDPFVWTLESSAYKTQCAYCLRKKESLQICAGCRLHRYCNVTCQTADWKMEHKVECAMLAKMDAKMKAEIVSVVTRCGIACSKQPPVELILKMANKVRLNTMVNIPGRGRRPAQELVDTLPQDAVLQDPRLEKSLKRLPTVEPQSGVAVAALVTYLAVVGRNTQVLYSTADSRPVNVGYAVYPVTPHCHMTAVCWDINVVLCSRKRSPFVLATEDIPVYTGWKDLRFTYLGKPFSMTRAERRSAFEEGLGYPCKCRKCTEEYDAEINPWKCVTAGCTNRVPSDSRAMEACTECGAANGERLKELRRFMELYAQMKAGSPTESPVTTAMAMQMCQKMDAAGILQPDAHFRYVCGWGLTIYYFKKDTFARGWKMTQELVACVRSIHPKYEPHGAALLLTASKQAAEALEKHVLDRIAKLSEPAKKQLEQITTNVFGVLIEYCQTARHVLTVLCGEESEDTKMANKELVGITNQSRKIEAMFRVQ